MSAGLHDHHVDGRLGPGLAYIDAGLVIALAPEEHGRLHLLLDDLDAGWPRVGEPLLVHRARRHAVTWGWAADHGRSLAFDAPAARSMQGLWLAVVDALGEVR
ncbi:MAG: hypothetical protein M0010_06130 [Actinomycetota bacterium]|nr:hypothetical protein [Actinomycetota bacterium]